MRGERICGIKALSNIKQNGERQSKEELGRKNERELWCLTYCAFCSFISQSFLYRLPFVSI